MGGSVLGSRPSVFQVYLIENFTLSGSTLVQTINYSGTDVYERNWAIDTENGFIYLIGNTESASTVQGNMVRVKKFALPLPTAGDVVFTAEGHHLVDSFAVTLGKVCL